MLDFSDSVVPGFTPVSLLGGGDEGYLELHPGTLEDK